uniref:Uncharacterized protein n=2 Tax=Aegilops tauschii subsp. strangulata TaxID=200361 RepID=A0A453NIR2_AEGTS
MEEENTADHRAVDIEGSDKLDARLKRESEEARRPAARPTPSEMPRAVSPIHRGASCLWTPRPPSAQLAVLLPSLASEITTTPLALVNYSCVAMKKNLRSDEVPADGGVRADGFPAKSTVYSDVRNLRHDDEPNNCLTNNSVQHALCSLPRARTPRRQGRMPH